MTQIRRALLRSGTDRTRLHRLEFRFDVQGFVHVVLQVLDDHLLFFFRHLCAVALHPFDDGDPVVAGVVVANNAADVVTRTGPVSGP